MRSLFSGGNTEYTVSFSLVVLETESDPNLPEKLERPECGFMPGTNGQELSVENRVKPDLSNFS